MSTQEGPGDRSDHLPTDYRFDAFISYRRSDGSAPASRLRQRLLDYRLPTGLREELSPRKLSVYLDTVYERATEDFFENTIKPALRASRHLIVVCTPGAVMPRADGRPNWVVREIEYFRSLPQRRNICVALAKGEFSDPLPAHLGEELENVERVDVRRTGALRGRNQDDEILKFIATLYAVPAERMPELREEEARRRAATFQRNLRISAAVIVILAGALVWAVLAQQRANVERRKAQASAVAEKKAKEEALASAKAEREARLRAESRRVAMLATSVMEDQYDLGLLLSVEARHLADTFEARSTMYKVLLHNPRIRAFLHGRKTPYEQVAFHPDGLMVASATGSEITLWDVKTRRRSGRPLAGHRSTVAGFAFRPDGKLLASSHEDGRITLWDVSTRESLRDFPAPGYTEANPAFSPDGKRLALGGPDGFAVVDLTTQSIRIRSFSVPSSVTGKVTSLAFAPNDQLLVS